MADEIFYLEYFYFITYVDLLIVMVHSIVLSHAHVLGRKLEYLSLTKQAFVPASFFALLVITVLTFY